MRKHEIPREKRNETRLFKIFSIRSMLYTLAFLAIGFLVAMIFSFVFPYRWLKYIILGVFGLVGFFMGANPIKYIKIIPATKNVQGLYLHEVIISYLKYRTRRSLKVMDEGV